jgi:hypothetical protein
LWTISTATPCTVFTTAACTAFAAVAVFSAGYIQYFNSDTTISSSVHQIARNVDQAFFNAQGTSSQGTQSDYVPQGYHTISNVGNYNYAPYDIKTL